MVLQNLFQQKSVNLIIVTSNICLNLYQKNYIIITFRNIRCSTPWVCNTEWSELDWIPFYILGTWFAVRGWRGHLDCHQRKCSNYIRNIFRDIYINIKDMCTSSICVDRRRHYFATILYISLTAVCFLNTTKSCLPPIYHRQLSTSNISFIVVSLL